MSSRSGSASRSPHAAALKAKAQNRTEIIPVGRQLIPVSGALQVGQRFFLPGVGRLNTEYPAFCRVKAAPKADATAPGLVAGGLRQALLPVREKARIRGMLRLTATRHSSSTRRIRRRSSSFCGGTKPRTALAVSEEDAIVFQLVEQVTHNINVVRRNNEGAGRTRLIWPLLAYATPDRKSIRRRETSLLADSRFSTQYAWRELVRNAGRIVKALRFDQNDLQLGRRVDVTTLLLCCLISCCWVYSCAAAAPCRRGKHSLQCHLHRIRFGVDTELASQTVKHGHGRKTPLIRKRRLRQRVITAIYN